MPGFDIPEELQARLDARRRTVKVDVDHDDTIVDVFSCVVNSPRKPPSTLKKDKKRNLLPAFNAVTDEWVVIALDDNKENTCEHVLTEEMDKARLRRRQLRASHNRARLLGERVTRAREMARPVSPADPTQKSPEEVALEKGLHIETKINAASVKKDTLLWEKICRARQLARLRTPRKRRPSLTLDEALALAHGKQAAAQERRDAILAGRVRRAVELGDKKIPQTMKERRQFQLDELNAKLQAAEERRIALLSTKRKRASELGDRGVVLSLKEKRQMLSDILSYKLEAARERRTVALDRRAKRAAELGEGTVLMRMNRRRQFLGDVLIAKLDAAEERRNVVLAQRKRVARSLGDGNLWQALALERKELSYAFVNLWHLKLEAASARRNILLIQRKRRAYELGDEIVRASVEVNQTLRAFGHAAKQRAAEIRRNGIQRQKVERARQLGDQHILERRARLKQDKVDRLMRKLEAAAAKRRRHLESKSKRAEELGTERVEKRQKNAIMHNCIQEAARIGRIKQAETRRNQNLVSMQTRAARSNARAAAIPSLVEQRQQEEKRMQERYLAFKMARAEMNRDVNRLLRCGMHGDPTFSLVKPIAFIV